MSTPGVLKARTTVLLLLVLTVGLPLFAADGNPSAWFSSDPQAAAYAAVETDISSVFSDAEEAGVPTALLMDKLQEGASKSVAPDRLVQALRAEAVRLTDGQAAVTRARIRL